MRDTRACTKKRISRSAPVTEKTWPELEAALKNVHDDVRQARHFERMQEMDLFSGEKPGRKKGHHER